MTNTKKNIGENTNIAIIAELIVEEYRFMNSYCAIIGKLFKEEQLRYKSTLNFHRDKINEFAQKANLGIVELENNEYDIGLPIKAINLDEYSKEDDLVIEQVLEPAIISSIDGTLIRTGLVIIAKKLREQSKANI